MTQHLICIIGTDGSGKTSLAEAVVSALGTRGTTARLVWLGAESFVMAPVRGVLKLAWARRGAIKACTPKPGAASQRVDYAAEIARKTALAAKYAWAVKLYLALVWADYRLQVAVKRWRSRGANTIVADRYLFDVVINVGLTLGWSPEKVVALAQSWLAKLPLPQVRVFLRVAPEVSVQRKNDIFDIDYLRLRFRYYEAIAQAYGFETRDGTLPIATNRDWLLARIDAETKRPLVIYVHANNSDIGGADKVLAMMAQHMRDYGRPDGGYRVVAALRLQTSIIEEYIRAGIPVIHHTFVRPQVSKGVVGLLWLAVAAPASLWFFWRLFGRERPAIVHVNDLYDFLPAMAARVRGIPVVWHLRMIPASERLRQGISVLLNTIPAQVIFISEAVATAFPRVTKPACDVIYDFADTSLRQVETLGIAARPAPLPQGARLVTMVGRVEPWKGQDIFINAVSALPETLRSENVFALVGGSVPGKEAYFSEVSAKARALGIWGLGNRSDVPDILRATDIAVHCSVSPEPLGAVVLESMLAGAATVATAHGGVPEIILDESQGVLVPPKDAPALVKALAALLTHPISPRQRFGRAARDRVLALTDQDRIAGQLQAVYRRLPPANAATR
jgi:glycosyltransferase involved in cell wall biosynthesis/thymidylate kinase